MNGNDRKIEILTPFNLALQWTTQVLFRPFDLEKWLVIGFAAFLSHLAGGSGTGINFNRPVFATAVIGIFAPPRTISIQRVITFRCG